MKTRLKPGRLYVLNGELHWYVWFDTRSYTHNFRSTLGSQVLVSEETLQFLEVPEATIAHVVRLTPTHMLPTTIRNYINTGRLIP